MLKKLIRKTLYSKYSKNFFNNDNFLSNFILKKTPVFQRKFIKITDYSFFYDHKFEKKAHSKDLNIPGEKFVFCQSLDNSIDLKKMNSVAGYVPYQHNNTQILLYNFFSKNYSLRKQLLGTIYFIKKSKKISQKWFLLPVDCVQFIDLKEFQLDCDNIIVELFHYRLPKNHGYHHGHLRFHGIYNNISTVHSSPVENFYFKRNEGISSRRYFPKWLSNSKKDYYIRLNNLFDQSRTWNIKKENLYGDYSKKTINPLGYNFFLENQKINSDNKLLVNSAFHDAQITNSDHKPHYELQLIFLPPIPKINATLYFTETILGNQIKAKIHFFYKDLKEKKTMEIKIEQQNEINLLNLHQSDLSAVDFVILEFLKNENVKIHQYVNIHYSIEDKILDNVHSQCLEDKRCLGYKTKLHDGPQGLKWMHFPEQNKFTSYLILANREKEFNFKLRVLYEDNEEKIIMFSNKYKKETNNLGQITINIRDLFIDNYLRTDCKGIIQVECKNYNIAGQLFSYNPEQITLSVDHLTGG